ncbi:MAG: hypothetical protein LIP00_09115 [Parabacteroides sp.]|nr:hypothetical protein [Parabacteroides sp.]
MFLLFLAVLLSCQGKQDGTYPVTYQVKTQLPPSCFLLICYRDVSGLATVCIRDTTWTKQVRLHAGSPSTLSCRIVRLYSYSVSRLFPIPELPVITGRITRPDGSVTEHDTGFICLTLPGPGH